MPKLGVTGALAVALLSGLAGYGVRGLVDARPPLVHHLRVPLMLTGGAGARHPYLLPPGTSLYFDRAFPEGFVRYKVYVNVEGTLLDVAPPTDRFWLNPLVAMPLAKGQSVAACAP